MKNDYKIILTYNLGNEKLENSEEVNKYFKELEESILDSTKEIIERFERERTIQNGIFLIWLITIITIITTILNVIF